MEFRSFREIDWQLLFIRTYTWLSTMYNLIYSQTTKSVKYLKASFQPELYALYEGQCMPVPVNDYTKDVAGTASVDFYYNRETKIISKTVEFNHIPRTLNIEGASIYHGDICLYDLTDFFDTTRYAGSQDIPSLDQWIGLWELENGIYLDPKKEFQIHIEFLGDGKEVFNLWRDNQTRWNQLTSNVPRLHRQVFRALTPLSPSPSPCSCPFPCPSGPDSSILLTSDLSGNQVDLSGNTVAATAEEVQ